MNTAADMKGRDFLKLLDCTPQEIEYLLGLASELKAKKKAGVPHRLCEGKSAALIFEKTSTRTRCAFEVAAFDLGMHAVYLDPSGSQIGKKESIADTARVLSRMFDGIEYRGFAQATVEELAEYASVPVWNGLTDEAHPTQVLADLLTMLCQVPGDYHLRFMTSHPKDASRKLIDVIAAEERICNHLHLPVQSGSDRILKEMNRHYTVQQYLELIDYAKAKIPDVTFSSDIIVGFPGETEEDFAATLELIRKVQYMQLFTFIYSKRTGTKAALMPDPATHKEKTERMARLLSVQEKIAHAETAALVGGTQRVLVEGHSRTPGTLAGRLTNNLVVEFAGDEALIGQYARVHFTSSKGTILKGELV